MSEKETRKRARAPPEKHLNVGPCRVHATLTAPPSGTTGSRPIAAAFGWQSGPKTEAHLVPGRGGTAGRHHGRCLDQRRVRLADVIAGCATARRLNRPNAHSCQLSARTAVRASHIQHYPPHPMSGPDP